MSDCEDFIDDNDVDSAEEELEPIQKHDNFGKRGKDIPWEVLNIFHTNKEYNESEIAEDIKRMYSARVVSETDSANTIRYTYKYARKVGWKVCPMGQVRDSL